MTHVIPSILVALLALQGCATPAPAAPAGPDAPPPRHVAALAASGDVARAIAAMPARLGLDVGQRALEAIAPANVREGGSARVALGVGSAPGGILGAAGVPGWFLGRGFAVRYFRFWRSGPYRFPYQRLADHWQPYGDGPRRPYLIEDGGGYYPFTWTAP